MTVFAFELATNSTTTSPVDPLVYATWALVLVSSLAVIISAIAVAVSALQNRKTQRIMAGQVEESAAQTRLQQRQFETLLRQQGRGRVIHLIRYVLSPSITTLGLNELGGRESSLDLRQYLTVSFTYKDAKYFEQHKFIVFRDFELEYKELAVGMREYDNSVVDPVRLRHLDLRDALLRTVNARLPELVAKYNSPTVKLRTNDATSTLIVDQGILQVLRGRPEQVITPDVKEFWETYRAEFVTLADQQDILSMIQSLRTANGACEKASKTLGDEVSALRDKLGAEYGITQSEYFVPEPETRTVYETVYQEEY